MKTKQSCDGLYSGNEFEQFRLFKEINKDIALNGDNVSNPCDFKANLHKAIFQKSKKRVGKAKRLSLKQAEQCEVRLARQSKQVVSPRSKTKKRPRKPQREMQTELKTRKTLNFRDNSSISAKSISISESFCDSMSDDSDPGLDEEMKENCRSEVNLKLNGSPATTIRNNRPPGFFWFWVDLDERQTCEDAKQLEDDFNLVLSVDDCGPCQRIIPTFENAVESVFKEEDSMQDLHGKRKHFIRFLNENEPNKDFNYSGNKITSSKSKGDQTGGLLKKTGLNKYAVLPNIKGSHSEQCVDTGTFLNRMRDNAFEPKVKAKYPVLPNINGTMYNASVCTDDEAEETVEQLSWRQELIKPMKLKKYPVLPNIKESYSNDFLTYPRSTTITSEDEAETIAFFLRPHAKEEKSRPEICASVDPFAKSRLRPPSERRLPPLNDKRMDNVAVTFSNRVQKSAGNPMDSAKKKLKITNYTPSWKMEEPTKDHQSMFRDVVLKMRQHDSSAFFDDTDHQKKSVHLNGRMHEAIYK